MRSSKKKFSAALIMSLAAFAVIGVATGGAAPYQETNDTEAEFNGGTSLTIPAQATPLVGAVCYQRKNQPKECVPVPDQTPWPGGTLQVDVLADRDSNLPNISTPACPPQPVGVIPFGQGIEVATFASSNHLEIRLVGTGGFDFVNDIPEEDLDIDAHGDEDGLLLEPCFGIRPSLDGTVVGGP